MVSICMAVYNGAKFIQSQLDSILPQLQIEDELIIIDDLSTDNSVELIRSFVSSNIRLYLNETNLGVIKTFEKALATAKGEFIFLCDQDDVWIPGKIPLCVELLLNYHLVVSDCYVVDERFNVISSSFFKLIGSGKGILKNLKKNTYQGCCMAFRKEILNIVLPFPATIPMHDEWIGFVAELFYRVKFEATPLIFYRRHQNTVSPQQAGHSQFSLFKKLSFRLNLLLQIPLLIHRRLFIESYTKMR